METKDTLQAKAEEGIALSELNNVRGWHIVCGYFKDAYAEALSRLEDGDDPEARATIKVIKNLVSRIDDKINLGSQARQELRDGLFIKQTGDTA